MAMFLIIAPSMLLVLWGIVAASRPQSMVSGYALIEEEQAMTEQDEDRPATFVDISNEVKWRWLEANRVVEQQAAVIDEMGYQRNQDVQHIAKLNAEIVRLQKMLDINDPTLEKVTIHRRDYKQLRDTEALAAEFASTILQVDGT